MAKSTKKPRKRTAKASKAIVHRVSPGARIAVFTARVNIRLTPEQREKLDALGGQTWLRKKLDGAVVR